MTQKSPPKKIKRATTEDSNTEKRSQDFLKEVQAILNEQTLNDLERVTKVCSLVDKWIQSSRLAKNPFSIAASEVEVKESDAEKAWRDEQLINLTREQESLQAELDSLLKQNESIATTSPIYIRNIALIKLLNYDLADLLINITKHHRAQTR